MLSSRNIVDYAGLIAVDRGVALSTHKQRLAGVCTAIANLRFTYIYMHTRIYLSQAVIKRRTIYTTE